MMATQRSKSGAALENEIMEKLRAYAKESGFSIADIATQIGIAPITLRRFLQSPVEVSRQAVDKIVDFVEGLN
jgi:transcriptional regulator with XRE-family HTH domain